MYISLITNEFGHLFIVLLELGESSSVNCLSISFARFSRHGCRFAGAPLHLFPGSASLHVPSGLTLSALNGAAHLQPCWGALASGSDVGPQLCSFPTFALPSLALLFWLHAPVQLLSRDPLTNTLLDSVSFTVLNEKSSFPSFQPEGDASALLCSALPRSLCPSLPLPKPGVSLGAKLFLWWGVPISRSLRTWSTRWAISCSPTESWVRCHLGRGPSDLSKQLLALSPEVSYFAKMSGLHVSLHDHSGNTWKAGIVSLSFLFPQHTEAVSKYPVIRQLSEALNFTPDIVLGTTQARLQSHSPARLVL